MNLLILDGVQERLRQLRAEQLGWPSEGVTKLFPELHEFFLRNDVVIITLGLGPAVYLRLDGRIIKWNYDDGESPRELSDPHDIAAGVALAVETWSMPELLALLPTRPGDGQECARCGGERWIRYAEGRWVRLSQGPEDSVKRVCITCCGLGWVTDRQSHAGTGALQRG
jgi:hypothetical protein